MRLIDADRMCADLATVDPQYEYMVDWCIRVTKAQPTVVEFDDDITKVVVRGNEYVPVIRCEDCGRKIPVETDGRIMNLCMWLRRFVKDDQYCCWGEKEE